MASAVDIDFIKQAIEVSKNSPAKPTCFRVGAILADKEYKFIASGYTLEFGEGWHAEAVVIKKAKDAGIKTEGAIIYSSLEPCSVRASGKKDCSALLIENDIAQVFYALAEPPIFVTCEGNKKLQEAKIKVEKINGFDQAVKDINAHLFEQRK